MRAPEPEEYHEVTFLGSSECAEERLESGFDSSKQSLSDYMQPSGKKKILAVVNDLMFTVKINDAAKRVGVAVEFVKSEKDTLDKAKEKPLLIILDLNFDGVKPLQLISKLKSDRELRRIGLISYLSHVQGGLKQQAHDAGCDMVLARSAFSQNLPQILKRYVGAF